MNRNLYFIVGSVCLCLVAVVAAEFDWSISPVSAAPSDAGHGDKAAIAQPNSADDMDKLTGEILARPLFTPGRHPPPAPVEEAQDEEPEQPKTAPVLTGRLSGMLIGPGELKEAIFSRESDTPLAVKEGDDIDGWTVSSIESDRVVLTSEFGERVVQPTFVQAARPAPRPPSPIKPKAPQPPNLARPRAPVAAAAPPPNTVRPGGPIPARANPVSANREPLTSAAKRNQRQ